MKKLTHLMVDIETLGNLDEGEIPIICQISAKWFNPETKESDNEFNEYIEINSCKSIGGNFTADTLLWWFKQDCKNLAKGLETNSKPIDDVMDAFETYIYYHCSRNNIDKDDIKIYANSPSFDLTILEHYFRKFDIIVPWKHNQKVDVRTIRSFVSEDLPKPTHDGIEDVKKQITIVNRFYEKQQKIMG